MTSPAWFDGDVKLQSVIGLDDWYNEIGAASDAAIDEANLTLPSDKQLVKDDTIITSFENLFKDNTLLRELETLEKLGCLHGHQHGRHVLGRRHAQ